MFATFRLLTPFIMCSMLQTVFCHEFDAGEGMNWQFGIADRALDTPTHHPTERTLEDLPIIVWWTENLYPHVDKFTKRTCPGSQCYVTHDHNHRNHSKTRGFIFYGTEMSPRNLPLPRLSHHEWAVIHEESPLNNFMLDHALAMSFFNHTATYHRDANYPLTLLSFPGTEFILNRSPVSTAKKNALQKQKGLAPIAYVQSHCEVPSDRDRYVEELMEHIKVDSYGKCLHNKDLPPYLTDPVETMFDKNFKDLMAKYKFIIAFENGICNDYMTEKLFRPLHVGSVPIYRGSPLARDAMPDNHSLIMADDFDSPQKLAEYIHYLDSNETAYEEYLEFKKTKKISNPKLQKMLSQRPWNFTNDDRDYGGFMEGFECYVCAEISDRIAREKKHPSVPLKPPSLTDGRKFACPTPEPFRTPKHMDWWMIHDYPEQYWTGLDYARTVRDMLANNEMSSDKFHSYLARYNKKPAMKSQG